MDVKHIAKLAHLEITADEVVLYSPQLKDIVGYVEQLNEIDLSGTQPMLGGLTSEGEATVTLRDDDVRASLEQDVALREAPAASDGHFQVPKVL